MSATLAGPLLKATDTDITATYGILTLRDRATFRSTTSLPLITLDGTTSANSLTLGGSNPDPTDLPSYGYQVNGRVLDVSPSLTPAYAASAELSGPILKATGTTISTTDRIIGVFGLTWRQCRADQPHDGPLGAVDRGQHHDVVLSIHDELLRDHDRYQRKILVDVFAGCCSSGDP